MDISVPAKKKLPMSYILGAAAVLLVIVALIVRNNWPKATETSEKVNTQSKQDGNPKVNNTDGLNDRIEDGDEDGEPKPVNNQENKIEKLTPLQKAIDDTLKAYNELDDLFKKYGGKNDTKKECSSGCEDDQAIEDCQSKIQKAKANLTKAKKVLVRINPKSN
jgi:hypothetical protein